MGFSWTIVALVVALGLTWRYLARTWRRSSTAGSISSAGPSVPSTGLLGTSPTRNRRWKRYAGSLVIFSAVSHRVHLPDPAHPGVAAAQPAAPGAVTPALSFNTAASFLTNTNWQNYGGETTMSYFSQIGALTVQQFVSPGGRHCRGHRSGAWFSRRNSPTIGNFWVDLTRCLLYILLPIAFVAGIIFVGQGAVQTLAGTVVIHDASTGSPRPSPGGRSASWRHQAAGHQRRWLLGSELGHHLREPDRRSPTLSIYLLLCIPFALTYTFGKMVGSVRHGRRPAGRHGDHLRHLGGLHQLRRAPATTPPSAAAGVAARPTGNTEGKEVRFGDTTTALFGVASTSTSTGSADASYDSFTPIGGFGLLTGMMLGEVTPGGTGTGLYTILIYAIIAVFIGGLMIGRTPEYLGKKIQAKEVKLAGLGALVMPIIVLVFTAIAVSIHAGRAGPSNAGPHGFTEILYALTSQGNNNGSAFGGLTGNTPFYNIVGGIDMLIGRFAIMIPALALGGVLAAKNVVPASRSGPSGPTTRMFVGLIIGVIIIIGGLTFFPAVSLGPIVEQLCHGKFF